jgi:hypothetical protein
MKSLFDISIDIAVLGEILAESGGEITDDEKGRALEDVFDNLYDERDRKIGGMIWLVKELEGRATMRQEEAIRLQSLSQVDRNAAQRIKTRIKQFMEAHDLKRLDLDHCQLTVAQNGGKAPLVIPEAWLDDPAEAPEAYQRRRLEVDLTAIRADLEDGETIEGCSIGERGFHLRIK